ncbi:MAG TPA: tRNA epoxyqueuosine(34) reductase QueG [Limnobacter sp.]|nr:tRNA epoxyqueuosine(34) reductase QueG [Limnobacter sp.]
MKTEGLEQKNWALLQATAQAQGLDCLGVSDTNLQACEPHLKAWLDAGMHGEMTYMAKYGMDRLNPDLLHPGAIRIVSVRIPYVSQSQLGKDAQAFCTQTLDAVNDPSVPYVSLYARGRDYHKVIRQRLKRLADALHSRLLEQGEFAFRVTCDSAPTPETEIARKAGLGWRGKHTLLIHPQEGSLFFLGEIFTNLPLPVSNPFEDNHCGQCSRCLSVCPTGAIVKPYQVDARRCVSYLTIEHESAIPLELRSKIGTRIYGCDDCQLVCPWNKFTKPAQFADFNPRPLFEHAEWASMMRWTEAEFLKHTEGSAIRRIGYRKFRRNLAVAAGNSDGNPAVLQGLAQMRDSADDFLAEHIDWALAQLHARQPGH